VVTAAFGFGMVRDGGWQEDLLVLEAVVARTIFAAAAVR
jgi:hypothetical protein